METTDKMIIKYLNQEAYNRWARPCLLFWMHSPKLMVDVQDFKPDSQTIKRR